MIILCKSGYYTANLLVSGPLWLSKNTCWGQGSVIWYTHTPEVALLLQHGNKGQPNRGPWLLPSTEGGGGGGSAKKIVLIWSSKIVSYDLEN